MAKKTKKPAVQKPSPKKTLQEASTDKEYIDEVFRKAVRKAENSRKEDLGGTVLKRRKAAVLAYLPEAARRYEKKLHSPIGENFFPIACSCSGYLVDDLEDTYCLTLAAAVWILDQLRENGKLAYALPLLELDRMQLWDVEVPDFADAQYDERIVQEMVWLIHYRNGDDDKCFITEKSARRKRGMVEKLPDTPVEDWTARERLTAIFSLLDETAVRKATQRFEQTMWKFLDTVCIHLDSLTHEATEAREEMEELHRALLEIDKKAKHSAETVTMSVADKEEMNALVAESMRVGEWAEGVLSATEDMMYRSHMIYAQNDETLQNWKPEDRKALEKIQVMDPYETCFAYLWLLDMGEDLPWLYNPVCAVLLMAIRKLPWATYGGCWMDRAEEYEDEDASEEVEEDGQMCLSGMGAEMPPDPILAKDELYSLHYADDMLFPSGKSPTEGWRVNLPQLIYAKTGLLMPREVRDWKKTAQAFAKADKSRAARTAPGFADAMGLYARLAEEAGFRIGHPLEDNPWKKMQEKRELEHLRSALAEAQQEAAAARQEKEKLEKLWKKDQRELERLREAVKKKQAKETND